MDLLAKFGTIFFYFSFLSITYGEDMCVRKGPCICVFSNGTGIDLTSSNKTLQATNFVAEFNGTQTTEIKLATYYYNPCNDILPPVNKDAVNNTCTTPVAMCRETISLGMVPSTSNDTYKKDKGILEGLGVVANSTFSSNGNALIYGNVPSVNTVLLVCSQFDDHLHVDPTADPNSLVLLFYSRSACLKTIQSPDEGRSVGSTLLIIFFSFVIFYLVLGVCTKKFMMGATGIEVIPNLGFWTDLPNLVKDGWAFSINGFKLPARGPGPVTTPDPNSYDSI